MSFPNFDPSQGQANQFSENNNGNATGPPQQAPPNMQPSGMPMMQQQGMQQQGGPNAEVPGAPFQGQGGMEQGSVGSAPGGDSKTTLWYVKLIYAFFRFGVALYELESGNFASFVG
jgi:hypothetical protein